MMGRQIEHLRRLIDDLLDVSRIDRGKLELARERISVEAFVRHAVETAEPVIDAKSHELVVHYASEPIFVDGDHVRLSQAVSNLLNNAAKFTPPGGRIEVTVRATGQEAVVSVRDNGIGFDKGDELRMFDMFVQLEPVRASSPGGLGLGLMLVRRITEMHGGTVEAHSAGRGQGAEFVLRLPRATAVEATPSSAIEPKRSATARRVLVVDDNAEGADTLGQIMTLEGFDVRVFSDPVQALAAARDFKPHVAFIDLNMPGMSGIEFATHLKAEAWASGMELVALTGMGQKEDVAATRRAGFDIHLTKPADPSRILELAAGVKSAP
jgi:CheY-like chemotaxis protein/two-component sensor histidine kinase